MGKLEKERDSIVRNLEANFNARKDKLEKQRRVLEEGVKKFNVKIAEFNQRRDAMEKLIEEKTKELEAKVEEKKKRINERNEELKKRIAEKTFNMRNAKRMKRESQTVEKGIEETEAAIERKLKELEALAMEGNHCQKVLNANGDMRFAEKSFNTRNAERMMRESQLVEKGIEEVEAAIERKLKEIESLAMEGNHCQKVEAHKDSKDKSIKEKKAEKASFSIRKIFRIIFNIIFFYAIICQVLGFHR